LRPRGRVDWNQESLLSPDALESVEEKAHPSDAPGPQVGVGKGCKEGGRHTSMAPKGAEAALRLPEEAEQS
jgi:hypothetical protein